MSKKLQQSDFTFGTAFRKMREKCDYTREQIADRAGISPRFLAAIENENRKHSLDVLIRLVHSIGVSFDEVLEPHFAAESETTDRIRRLVSQCSKQDQELLLALINQMLDTKERKNNAVGYDARLHCSVRSDTGKETIYFVEITFLSFWKDSLLIVCSILHASLSAVIGSTPAEISCSLKK